jgi:hypothetical protein
MTSTTSDSAYYYFITAVLAVAFTYGLILLIQKLPESLEMRRSTVNGKSYGVQEMLPNANLTADRIAKLEKFTTDFMEYLTARYPNDVRTQRLLDNLVEIKMEESPFEDDTSSYTVNKGELIALCIRNKEDKDFHDWNTLLFVLIHELGHVSSVTTGHNEEFIRNFKWLLERANEAGLYTPVDYSKSPITYCGVRVTNNPML